MSYRSPKEDDAETAAGELEALLGWEDVDVRLACGHEECSTTLDIYSGVVNRFNADILRVKAVNLGWAYGRGIVPDDPEWFYWVCPGCSDPNWTDCDEEEGGEG